MVEYDGCQFSPISKKLKSNSITQFGWDLPTFDFKGSKNQFATDGTDSKTL